MGNEKETKTEEKLPEKLSYSEGDYEIVLILSREEKFFRRYVRQLNVQIVEDKYLQQIFKHQFLEFIGKTRLVDWRTAFEETFPEKSSESPYKEIYAKLEKKDDTDISKQPSDLLNKRIRSIVEERLVKLAVAGYMKHSSSKALYHGLGTAKMIGQGIPRLVDKDCSKLSDRIEFLDEDENQRGRFVRGSLTLVGGRGGAGKGVFVTGRLGAAVTSGGEFMGAKLKKGKLFLLDVEDLWPTLRDRIINNGGDLTNFHWIEMEKDSDGYAPLFSLREHLSSLAERLKMVPEDVRKNSLVVIDNLGTFMGFSRGIEAMNQYDVRKVLQPVAMLAEEFKITIIVIGNFNKSKLAELAYAMSDSVAFVDTCRASYAIIADEEQPDRRFFLPIKWNLVEIKDTGEEFEMLKQPKDEIVTVRDLSAQEVQELKGERQPGQPRSLTAIDNAKQFITAVMKENGEEWLKIMKMMKMTDVKQSTLYAARKMMPIETIYPGGVCWWVWKKEYAETKESSTETKESSTETKESSEKTEVSKDAERKVAEIRAKYPEVSESKEEEKK